MHVVQLMPLPSQNPIISRHLKHIKLAVYQALRGTAPHYLSEELCNVADVPVGERSSPVVDLQSAGCPTVTPRCLGSLPVLYLCTGVVRTLERLDREAVGRHSLTLMVRDRGTPLPRRSYARLIVNVLDVNDHSPEFLSSHYTGRVYSTALPGTAVAQLTATDRDHAHNALVTYHIVAGRPAHLNYM